MSLASAIQDRDQIIKKLIEKSGENRKTINNLLQAVGALSHNQQIIYSNVVNIAQRYGSKVPTLPALRMSDDDLVN